MLSLVEAEANYGSTLKALLEGGKVEETIAGLRSLAEERQGDIASLCSGYYSELLGSTDELSGSPEVLSRVSTQLRTLSSTLSTSSAEFCSAARSLSAAMTSAECSREARTLVARFGALVGLCHEAKKAVDQGLLGRALACCGRARKALSSEKGELAAFLSAQLPVIEESIRATASVQYNEWLSEAWSACPRVGQSGFSWASSVLRRRRHQALLMNLEQEAYRTKMATPAGELGEAPVEEERNDDLEFSLVPLHQAMFVFEKLGKLAELRTQYADTKRLQVAKIYQQASSGSSSAKVLRMLAGFFIIEYEAVSSTALRGALLRKEAMDDLWRTAVTKCKALILNELSGCRTTAAFRETADGVITFSELLGRYGYDVSQTLEVLQESARRYADVAFEEFSAALDVLFRKNSWEPLVIHDLEEARVVLPGLLADASEIEKASHPRKAPFSPLVPQFVRLVEKLVVEFFGTAEELVLGDVERLVTKTADQCLQRVCRLLSQKPPKDMFAMAAQFLADLHALTPVPRHLESFVSSRCTWGYVPLLETSRRMLEASQAECEAELQTMLQSSLDTILGPFVSAVWTAPLDPPNVCHPFVGSISEFLTSLSSAFDGVPAPSRHVLFGRTLKRIADVLIMMMLGDQVKKIPYSALSVLVADTVQLEELGHKHTYGPESNGRFFAEVRQVVQLLRNPDVEQWRSLSTATKGVHPVLTDSSLVQTLLEKVKDDKTFPPTYSKSVKALLSACRK